MGVETPGLTSVEPIGVIAHYNIDKALLVAAPNQCSTSQAARALAPLSPEDIFGVVLNRAAQ